MKLTIQLQLLPDSAQKSILLMTMERFNEAASFAARVGFDAGVFSQPSIHKLAYRAIREQFGLSAPMAVRAIGKAVETFARDKAKCPPSSLTGPPPTASESLASREWTRSVCGHSEGG